MLIFQLIPQNKVNETQPQP